MDWKEIVGSLADIMSVLGVTAPFAAYQAYRARQEIKEERARQNAKISVILHFKGVQDYQLPVPIRRAELTRAEILGRLGMIPMKPVQGIKKPQFNLAFTNDPDFLAQLNQVREGDGDATLTFNCTAEELEQFAID